LGELSAEATCWFGVLQLRRDGFITLASAA
jgi:hypothetical protein